MRHTKSFHATRARALPLVAAGAQAIVPALLAALLGSFILFGVALAWHEVLHNAAHDARHAFAFPCH